MDLKKNVSFLGDSLSTYKGYNPDGYHVFYDEFVQNKNGLKSVNDTWWSIVADYLSCSVLANDAFSGSKVSGGVFPSASCLERIKNLKNNDIIPDYILIYIGFNDWGNGVRIKKWLVREDADSFEYSYGVMLSKLIREYPNSKIVCGTLMETYIRDDKDWTFPRLYAGVDLNEYNKAIRQQAHKMKVRLADLYMTGRSYETLDGSHATVLGHKEIANAWIKCLDEMKILKD